MTEMFVVGTILSLSALYVAKRAIWGPSFPGYSKFDLHGLCMACCAADNNVKYSKRRFRVRLPEQASACKEGLLQPGVQQRHLKAWEHPQTTPQAAPLPDARPRVSYPSGVSEEIEIL